MTRLYKVLIVTLIVFCGAGYADAQVWGPHLGLGLRGTIDGGGLSAKLFIVENVSIEGLYSFSNGFDNADGPSKMFTGLLAYNFYLMDRRWRIFAGVGAHAGTWKQYEDNRNPSKRVHGYDAIIGAEYVFREVPIGLSLDVKPAMNYFGPYHSIAIFPNNCFGASVRYYIGGWGKSRRYKGQPIMSGRG